MCARVRALFSRMDTTAGVTLPFIARFRAHHTTYIKAHAPVWSSFVARIRAPFTHVSV